MLFTGMMTILIVIFCLFITVCALEINSKHEPQCYSRFEYEYKVVQKLVELENDAKEQQTVNKALESKLESTRSEMEQRVDALEKRNGQLNNNIEDMKIVNEELKSEIQTMKTQLLELKGRNDLVLFDLCPV